MDAGGRDFGVPCSTFTCLDKTPTLLQERGWLSDEDLTLYQIHSDSVLWGKPMSGIFTLSPNTASE